MNFFHILLTYSYIYKCCIFFHKLVDYFIHYYRKIKKFLKNIIFSLTYGKSKLRLLIWIGRYIRGMLSCLEAAIVHLFGIWTCNKDPHIEIPIRGCLV